MTDVQPATPAHIIVVNHSTLAKDEDIAYWAEGVRKHVQTELAPAWGIAPPGVFFYGSSANIPLDQDGAAFIGIVDDDGNAESAGYHTLVGDVVFGLVDMGQSSEPSRTLDHEVCEMVINPQLMRTAYSSKNDLQYFVEVSDPVEAQLVTVSASILGNSRDVLCSNFVTPAWFNLDAGTKFDQLGNLTAPFQLSPGGYCVALDADGKAVQLSDRAALSRKFTRTHRTGRIVAKIGR